MEIDYSKYEGYFANTEEYKTLEKEFNSVTAETIENTYKKELEKEIKDDIEESFEMNVKSIDIDINLETGEIEKIYISLNSNSDVSVNKIEIGNSSIKNQDTEKIKSTLTENYGIKYENITIK